MIVLLLFNVVLVLYILLWGKILILNSCARLKSIPSYTIIHLEREKSGVGFL